MCVKEFLVFPAFDCLGFCATSNSAIFFYFFVGSADSSTGSFALRFAADSASLQFGQHPETLTTLKVTEKLLANPPLLSFKSL